MTLIDWIEREGEQRAAELLGVTERAVRSWRFGERKPKPETAGLIVKRTHGEVSFAGCYGLEENTSEGAGASV